jgi:hypothetical protein
MELKRLLAGLTLTEMSRGAGRGVNVKQGGFSINGIFPNKSSNYEAEDSEAKTLQTPSCSTIRPLALPVTHLSPANSSCPDSQNCSQRHCSLL